MKIEKNLRNDEFLTENKKKKEKKKEKRKRRLKIFRSLYNSRFRLA